MNACCMTYPSVCSVLQPAACYSLVQTLSSATFLEQSPIRVTDRYGIITCSISSSSSSYYRLGGSHVPASSTVVSLSLRRLLGLSMSHFPDGRYLYACSGMRVCSINNSRTIPKGLRPGQHKNKRFGIYSIYKYIFVLEVQVVRYRNLKYTFLISKLVLINET
jgi:hypothetical protein